MSLLGTSQVSFFDTYIIEYLNQLSQHSHLFDQLICFISESYLFKGIPWMIALWWLWFTPKTTEEKVSMRSKLLTCLLATMLAIFLTLVLTGVFSLRPRPMHNPALAFVIPYGVNLKDLTEWSSFPSDHAAMMFALALGLWTISTRWGLLALAYTLIVVLLPRVYLGYHYPTDLVAGFLVAALMVWLANQKLSQRFLVQPVFKWYERHPASFYAGLFFLTSQMAVLFEPLRSFTKTSIYLLRVLIKS